MRTFLNGVVVALVCVGLVGSANAAVISGPDIIPAPASVIDDPPGATNEAQQGFDEAQCVQLPRDVDVDGGGFIAEGTWVSSHMLFLNSDGTTLVEDFCQLWQFDGEILGVMSNGTGSLEAASNDVLGAAGTVYPGTFSARGLEGNRQNCFNDGYTVLGDTLELTMRATEPGDWIRVVTECNFPVVIDVKPGSDPNCFNINGYGVVPVAINGSADFDVTDIDWSTLTWGGLWVKVKRNGDLQCGYEDWNEDGFEDLVCHFEDDPELWYPGDGEATLTGETWDGMFFSGTDAICLRP